MKQILLFALAFLTGCAAFGVTANEIAGGNHLMPAKFVPPNEPTLVLVENDRMSGGGDPDCRRLAQFIGHDLEEHKVVPLVTDDALFRLRDSDPGAFARLSIAALGRAAGAKQIIYVSILTYEKDTPLGSDHIKWSASVRVKVVDAQTGESRWPLELSDGQPLSAETDFTQIQPNGAGSDHVRDNLNQVLAVDIGKLFHDWNREHDEAGDYPNDLVP